jgi:hypothetical protein
MIVESDGYRFNFTDAIHAFNFDDKNPASPTYHDTRMKAIDVIAELPNAYVFVEIKEYPASYDPEADWGDRECDEINCVKRKNHSIWLKNYLKYKYRDSFLYRFAENKVGKPIHYLCLLNFDNALNSQMQKTLAHEIPLDKLPTQWTAKIVDSCQVLNLSSWNRNFPNWPVQKI